MGFLSVLSMAHRLVRERVRPGDTAIDATAGGGNDTLLLAQLVGRGGQVIAFDVQVEALEQTRGKLLAADSCGWCRLVPASHSEMERHVEPERHGSVAAVMFNLGYLPGADDKSVITQPETTLPAMQAALRLLRPGGVLTAVLYPGHSGGTEEAAAVEAWAGGLPQRHAQTVVYRFLNAPATAPYLVAVEKKDEAAYNRS